MFTPKSASYGVLVLTPLFFSSNLLFGKVVVEAVEPWSLALFRWLLVSLVLLPFVAKPLLTHGKMLRENISLLALMGFLGMWICGAIVYFGLVHTTATNATLIYLSSPVLIIIIEAIMRGRTIKLREAIGIAFATLGVMVILFRGDVSRLTNLAFNVGDLAILFAAVSWAVYSVVFKSPVFTAIPSHLALFCFAFAGAIMLAPFALIETTFIRAVPTEAVVWFNILGIVFCSSLIAFLGYQFSVRFAGPAIAGIFMYLLPVYGVGLSVLLLGEAFEGFHMVGIITILGGVILATFPKELLKKNMKVKAAEGVS